MLYYKIYMSILRYLSYTIKSLQVQMFVCELETPCSVAHVHEPCWKTRVNTLIIEHIVLIRKCVQDDLIPFQLVKEHLNWKCSHFQFKCYKLYKLLHLQLVTFRWFSRQGRMAKVLQMNYQMVCIHMKNNVVQLKKIYVCY